MKDKNCKVSVVAERKPRILIQRKAAIGDVFLATAVIPWLKKHYPNYEIDFATSIPSIAELCPFIDNIIGINEVARKQYDRIFNLDLTYERCPSRSIISVYAETIVAPENEIQPQLHITSLLREKALRLLNDNGVETNSTIIVIQTGASFWPRRWPTENFEIVVAELKKHYKIVPILVGSPDDPYVKSALDLRGKCDIKTAIALVTLCKAFIGVDSSFIHFAKAAKIPVAAFFGPTNPLLRIIQSPQDKIFISNISCRFCHHCQKPPAFITVCKKQPFTCYLLDQILQQALRISYSYHNKVAIKLASSLINIERKRRKRGKIAPCMQQISAKLVKEELVKWFENLGIS